MSNTKISDMTPGAALTGAEQFEMNQAGTFNTTATAIATFVCSAPRTFTGGTVTTSQPVLGGTQTWNAGGVTFTGRKLNITDTASAAASLLDDLQVAGVSQWNVGKAGVTTQLGNAVFNAATAGPTLKTGANGRTGTFVCNGATPVTVSNTLIAVTDVIVISLSVVGGTVGAIPTLKTITAATGFTVAGTAGDTSTYSYAIIKVA